MKKNIIISSALAVMMLPAMVSCGSDYLQEEPLTGISDQTVNGSDAGADAAVTGLARQMSRQFGDLKNGNLNASGELFFRNLYGEGLSPDSNIGEITNYANSVCNPTNFRTITGWWAAWMYDYCYSIINSANNILSSIPEDNLTQSQNWLKAQTLTFRANAYYRLMQVYAPRWADSNNGAAYCIVLRLNAAEPNEHPFNTCNEVYDQMYKDLREAIELFKDVPEERKDRGENKFYCNAAVAKGVLARFAMLKNDYTTAQQMAKEAREDFPLMTADEYVQGFSTDSDAWMWAPAMDPLGIYYWGYGPHYACNGHYVISWGYSCSMDYHLYHQLKATDVRASLYFGPLLVDLQPKMAEKYGITKEDFFSSDVTLQTKLGVSITGTGKSPKGKNKDMWDFIKAYGKTFNSVRPLDIKGIYLTNTKGISLGVQYKFQGLDDGYTSCWPPFMRAEEMLLTEAEAAYMNNDAATAADCIKELMAVRDESYTLPAASGQGLLDEIKLQRKIELWGEGFSWFDYKRWGEVIERRAWDPSDLENCGGWPSTLARTYQPDFMMGWRAAIPRAEFTYNKEADASLVGL
ncbi:MAG: RagB/SusD family nutrient uptake outer membrane protein [Muribaculaceae bacterium]|nr:RagB/SusD family nutrient uptake outer membrane protein [Muribaculaceae bacterium]